MTADRKVTELTELSTIADDDWLYIVDKSNTTDDAAGSSFKAQVSNVRGAAESLTTNPKILLATDSGKTFYLNRAAGISIALPAPAIGIDVKFIVGTAPSGGAYSIVTDSSANIMETLTLDVVGELVSATAQDIIQFPDGVSITGDRLECNCDGTLWHCIGYSGANGGVITAQVS